MSTAVKMFLMSKKGKNLSIGIIIFMVVISTFSCSMCGYKATQISIQEVIKYFRPALVIEILPKLETGSYKEKIMYATYIELMLAEYEGDRVGRTEAVEKILNSAFYYDDSKDTFTAVLNDDEFFRNVEERFGIEIGLDMRIDIVTTANKIDLKNNAQELADYASSQVGNRYTTYEIYALITGEWDSTFVSYCCDRKGYVRNGYYKKYTDRNVALSECRKTGKFQDGYAYGNKYIPFPGDIIFLNRDCENSTTDQMGIVTKVEGTTITMVVGDGGMIWNKSSVATREYEYNSECIVGYYPISNYVNQSILEE